MSSFVSRMLGKGNIAGLVEKMKQADVDLEKQARCSRDAAETYSRDIHI